MLQAGAAVVGGTLQAEQQRSNRTCCRKSSRGSTAAGETAVCSGSSTVQASGDDSGSSVELGLSIDW